MAYQSGQLGKRKQCWAIAGCLSERSPGQIVVLFAISITAMVALLGMIFDGGNIYVQRRTAQNAADAGSLAGTRALMHVCADPSLTCTPDPTLAGGEKTIAEAVCQYVTANAFGTQPKATANFVGVSGNILASLTLPTDPLDATNTILKCGIDTYNQIPAAAAGVQVDTSIQFNTYLAGMVGVPNIKAIANASTQGAAVTAFDAHNAPFIICGVNTWRTAFGTLKQSVLKMSGGTPVIPYQIDPAAVGNTFIIHDSNNVANCGIGNTFKGLADSSGNAGKSTMPADLGILTTSAPAKTVTSVDGYGGCAKNLDPKLMTGSPCTMIVPIAIGPGTTSDLACVIWAAFTITQTAPDAHSAKLLANYAVAGGPESFTWTWGSRASISADAVGLSR